jgi:AcrR family transcriptional regulator
VTINVTLSLIDEQPTIRNRILDAAVEIAAEVGLTRLAVGDVAKRAGLSRQTLYRNFATKDALVTEAVAREAMSVAARVTSAASGSDASGPDVLRVSLAAALTAAREHPLLDGLIRTEPEVLLPLLTTDGGPVLSMVRTALDGILATSFAGLDEPVRCRLADILTRLLVSYAISPPSEPPDRVAEGMTSLLINQLGVDTTRNKPFDQGPGGNR